MKHIYVGLVCVGSWGAPLYLGEFPRRGRSAAPSAQDRPAPGHPERLVPDLPLSKVERKLWRQLLS